MKLIDLSNQKFGRLFVIGPAKKTSRSLRWVCSCDCGNLSVVHGEHLKSGHTRSCGCLQIENRILHNHARSRTYISWQKMKSRCCNENDDAFPWYGGSGVIVCERWLKSFTNFLEDMGERPEGTSINRKIDPITGEPFKIYSKEACEWADKWKQAADKGIPVTNKLGEKYITSRDGGRYYRVQIVRKKVKILDRTCGTLDEAIKVRDAFLANGMLPIPEDLGEKYIHRRRDGDYYRVQIVRNKVKILDKNCKTLDDAIKVRDNFIDNGGLGG